MIHIRTTNDSRFEITCHRDVPADRIALDTIIRSLRRSKYTSHQVTVCGIERQCEQGHSLVRVSLNHSAAARVENSLRWMLRARGLYPTRTHCDLHEALARALNLRLSVVQA